MEVKERMQKSQFTPKLGKLFKAIGCYLKNHATMQQNTKYKSITNSYSCLVKCILNKYREDYLFLKEEKKQNSPLI